MCEDEVDYSEDLGFWTDASPDAAYDYLVRTGKRDDVPDDQWKRLCNELQRRRL